LTTDTAASVYYSIVSVHMSESITRLLNDVSLVLYRVNEHIHKKVPILVQEKVREEELWYMLLWNDVPGAGDS